MKKIVYTLEDIAEILGFKRNKTAELMKGMDGCFKEGRKLFISVEAFEEWVRMRGEDNE